MDQSEVEKLIGELETALDRLRSLYEQYFVGIERIEPAVARKDVDRRFYVLRKEQIRNTALRYRFQMLLQKYNTYQTHWQRVCREIENGTYKRHLVRAQRRFGSSRPPRRRSSIQPPDFRPEPGGSPPRELAAGLAELDGHFEPGSIDVEIPMDDVPSSRPPSRQSPLPSIAALGSPQPASAAHAAPRPLPSAGASVWRKVTPGAPPPSPTLGAAAPQRAVGMPPQAATRPAAAGAQPLLPRVAAPAGPPLAPRPTSQGGPSQAQSAARPGPVPASRPVDPQASAHRPLQVGAPPAPPKRPDPPRPTPGSRPPPRPSFVPPRPAPSQGELTDKRLRQIYVEYVDAKRRQNESTAAITFQSVAKSLRESGERLRQKHGKDVDFEVALKDGKTILRPVLK